MILRILAVGTVYVALSGPAIAQEGRYDMPPTTPAYPNAPRHSPTPHESSARTGTATDTAATTRDLATGAMVKDALGMEVGKITHVGKVGSQTMVTLSSEGKSTTVPAASISKSGTGLMSSSTKEEIWAPK